MAARTSSPLSASNCWHDGADGHQPHRRSPTARSPPRSCTTSRRATSRSRRAAPWRTTTRATRTATHRRRRGRAKGRTTAASKYGGKYRASDKDRDYDADYYSKGKYKYAQQAGDDRDEHGAERQRLATADARAAGGRGRGELQERLPAARQDGDARDDRGDPGQFDAGRSERGAVGPERAAPTGRRRSAGQPEPVRRRPPAAQCRASRHDRRHRWTTPAGAGRGAAAGAQRC